MELGPVIVKKEQCIGCGMCADICPTNNIELIDQKAQTKLADCLLCGQCYAVCPKEAITLQGYREDQKKTQKQVRLQPEELLHVIEQRRSIRHFQSKEIPKEVIEQILEAGRLTHTAKNMQDVSYVVLDQEKTKLEQMAVRLFRIIKPFVNLVSPMARNNEIHDHFFFFNAPIAIVILAKEKENGLLAAQNMEFVAEAHGLGVLFSGYFTMAVNASRKMKKALQIPKGKRVAMTLVLGYPSKRFLRPTQHKPLDVLYK